MVREKSANLCRDASDNNKYNIKIDEKNHINICKFENETERVYIKTVEIIIEWMQQSYTEYKKSKDAINVNIGKGNKKDDISDMLNKNNKKEELKEEEMVEFEVWTHNAKITEKEKNIIPIKVKVETQLVQ